MARWLVGLPVDGNWTRGFEHDWQSCGLCDLTPVSRRQGGMSTLLSYACDCYKERGINRLFITALEYNLPSRATIEKAGGVLQDITDLEQGQRLARYWIDLLN